MLRQARALARRAALAKDSWLEPRLFEADPQQGFGVHLLHEGPEHELAIFAVSWLPGRGTPPHDHGTWALVAGVEGAESNEFFARLDDRSRAGHARLRKTGEKLCGAGEVLAMPAGAIHSVRNDTGTPTLSLHIYGRHINFTGRSRFDAQQQTETAFVVKLG